MEPQELTVLVNELQELERSAEANHLNRTAVELTLAKFDAFIGLVNRCQQRSTEVHRQMFLAALRRSATDCRRKLMERLNQSR
ncbi:MAG: hypothetical protein JW828_11920 [Sedimentisphaerales bacterium]|nr:hypothetical protein [Sedimentisphaerales bacterium]